METSNYNNSRRKFLQSSSLLLASLPLMKLNGFAAANYKGQALTLQSNTQQIAIA
jgi:hypothetical protein